MPQSISEAWDCSCGQANDVTDRVCHVCGKPKPMSGDAEEEYFAQEYEEELSRVFERPEATGK
ncbi:MAG: hypothetical protein NT058_01305 [Candidatus Portnoybacteria bacterium]|nr:hypothetical protein [Candidatus Portnoybacteria bacterium]